MTVNRKKRAPKTAKKSIRKETRQLSPYVYVKLLVDHGIYSVGQVISVDRIAGETMIAEKKAEYVHRDKSDRDIAADHVAAEDN